MRLYHKRRGDCYANEQEDQDETGAQPQSQRERDQALPGAHRSLAHPLAAVHQVVINIFE